MGTENIDTTIDRVAEAAKHVTAAVDETTKVALEGAADAAKAAQAAVAEAVRKHGDQASEHAEKAQHRFAEAVAKFVHAVQETSDKLVNRTEELATKIENESRQLSRSEGTTLSGPLCGPERLKLFVFTCSLSRRAQAAFDLGIAGLTEIRVVVADGVERLGSVKADDTVDFARKAFARLDAAHRNCDQRLLGAACAQ